MNFKVDLILAEEQRSASLLNPKSILRIIMIVVPTGVALMIAKFAFGIMILGNDVAEVERKWKAIGPQVDKAAEVRASLIANLDIVSELAGWRETHIDWHRQLGALQAEVPTNIQLTTLSVQQSLLSDPVPSRSFQLLMSGRSIGDPNGTRVVDLESCFSEEAAFKEAVKSAKVVAGSFLPDPSPQAGKEDRLFRIECNYRERVFK